MADLLRVPPERQHLEAVEQADQARGPVGAVHVDHVDPGLGELRPHGAPAARRRSGGGSSARGARRAPARPSFVQQTASSRSTATGGRVAPASAGHRHQRLAGGGVVDVERELVVGARLGVQVGQAGHGELGELGRGALGHPLPAPALAGDRPVDEHHLAVDAQPGVGLEAPGPQLAAPGGRRPGCSRARRRWRRGGRR